MCECMYQPKPSIYTIITITIIIFRRVYAVRCGVSYRRVSLWWGASLFKGTVPNEPEAFCLVNLTLKARGKFAAKSA